MLQASQTKISPAKLHAMLGYKPFAEQSLIHKSNARFKVPCCGRRFGKSLATARDVEPDLFIPKTMHWIVGPSYELAEKEFRVIWDDVMIKLGLIKDKRVKRAYQKKQGNMFIEFPWGSRLEVKSSVKDENIVGDALDTVVMSEAAKHDIETWERFIRPALSDRRGRAILPSTPEGLNWYYKLWLLGKSESGYESWKFPTWANKVIYPKGIDEQEIQSIKRNSTPEWFNQEYGAEFTTFVGKIYSEFNEQDHVKRHIFNPNWANYISIDWGFSRPMAAIEFQVDPQDNVYVWREFYEKNMTLHEALAKMKQRTQPDNYRLDLCFGDAADPQAVQTTTELFAPCISDPEAKRNWRQGVDLVKRHLQLRHDGVSFDDYERPVNERPKLIIDPTCTNTISEFQVYRVKKNSSAKESSASGVANNIDDHAMDALRYGMMHVFEIGVGSDLSYLMPERKEYSSSRYDKVTTGAVAKRETYFTTGGLTIMDRRF